MIYHAKLSDAAAIQKINLEILGYNYDVGATKAQLARVLQQPGQIILVAKNQTGQVIGMPMQLAMIASIFRLYSTCWR